MIESQHIDDYLDKTASPGTRWTVDTYLSYTLHGRAKAYSSRYRRHLMAAIARRIRTGEVMETRSKGGGTAYIRVERGGTT